MNSRPRIPRFCFPCLSVPENEKNGRKDVMMVDNRDNREEFIMKQGNHLNGSGRIKGLIRVRNLFQD